MRLLLPVLLLIGSSGCAIADKSDSFGAGLEISTGGFLEYLVPIKIKGFVGFSKSQSGCGNCGKETPHGESIQEGGVGPGTVDPPYL